MSYKEEYIYYCGTCDWGTVRYVDEKPYCEDCGWNPITQAYETPEEAAEYE